MNLQTLFRFSHRRKIGAELIIPGSDLRAHQSWTEQPEEDLEDAFSMGGRAIELSPGDPRVLFWWAHVHFYGGRTDDAIGILANAAARDSSFVPTHILHGAALILGRQPDKGIARIKHALNLAPDHALAFQAQLWLGIGQMERDYMKAAESAFLEAISANVIKVPVDSAAAFWAWVGIAGACAGPGRKTEAEAILERLSERFPDHDDDIMLERAEITFAPNLERLKMVMIIRSLLTPPPAGQPLPQPKPSSLRTLFRKPAGSEPLMD